MPAETTPAAAPDEAHIATIETALHALGRGLMKGRLHDHLARQAGVQIDQAGLAVLYVLNEEKNSLRGTDVAGRLAIDPPALPRNRLLTSMPADWPEAERCEFARLIGRFSDEIHCHLDELNL